MLQFLLTISDESNHDKIKYIYDRYHEYMMRFALGKLRDAGRRDFLIEAEDVVQNCFMKIVGNIDKINLSRSEVDVKNYCITMLDNVIYDFLNKKEENFEIFEEFCAEKEYNFVEELEIREKYEEVVRAIVALDEKYSSTLYLAFCEDMTVNEIAEMMGISAKTVYTRLARGKKILKESIKGEMYDE